jgi:hypothetical protein
MVREDSAERPPHRNPSGWYDRTTLPGHRPDRGIATADSLNTAAEAFGRASAAVNAWERETGIQVDDL